MPAFISDVRPGNTRDVGRTVGRQEIIEPAAFWFYVAGLGWVPFWYGSNDLIAWGINALLFPGLAIVYEISLLIRGKAHPVAVRHIALPAAMFLAVVAWIAVQTITWVPASLVSPIWGVAAEALGRPLPGSISVNRDLTILALIRLITAASVFWLALQLCRGGARAVAMTASIATIGASYAVYGLIALKTGQPAWLDIPADGSRVTSTFVNHNSFATFAGMGLVAIAALLVNLYRREVIAGGSRRLWFASFIETTGQKGAVLLAGSFVILVALLLTGSRGGVISTALGLFVLVILLRPLGRNRDSRTLGAILFGAVAIAAAVYVFGGILFDTLDGRGISDASRLSVYQLTLRSVLDAPLSGFGYGTFVDVFPLYRDRSISVLGVWGQAHDTYLELYQGLGVVFASLLIAAIGLLTVRCARGAIRRQQHAVVPAAAASTACLVGVHSLVDFSLQMQAVALIFMAVLGAGVAQSDSSRLLLED